MSLPDVCGGARPRAPLAAPLTGVVPNGVAAPAGRAAGCWPLRGPSREAEVWHRARPALFGPVGRGLRWSVVVPARDEARALPRLVAALDRQRDGRGRPFARGEAEALVLLNNCRDATAAVAAALAETRPWLRWAHVALRGARAHVGAARQLAMDAACVRLGGEGLILSTDADTAPAPDWLAATAREAERAEVVGGRALLHADERAALAPGVRRLYLLDIAYRRALEELCALYAPERHDPFPRHHHQFGASLAVTARAYAWVGGLPAARTSEDVALVDALRAAGARIRHSPRVRVRTSARATGRAEGGLADAFAWWAGQAAAGREPAVEPAADAERRLAALGLWAAAHPGAPHPSCWRTTPPAAPGRAQPLPHAIAGLRARIAKLRRLSLAERLARADRLVGRPAPSRPALPLAA